MRALTEEQNRVYNTLLYKAAVSDNPAIRESLNQLLLAVALIDDGGMGVPFKDPFVEMEHEILNLRKNINDLRGEVDQLKRTNGYRASRPGKLW